MADDDEQARERRRYSEALAAYTYQQWIAARNAANKETKREASNTAAESVQEPRTL